MTAFNSEKAPFARGRTLFSFTRGRTRAVLWAMVEIDLKGNYLLNGGYPREDFLVDRELYRLMTIFGSSKEIDRRRAGDDSSIYALAMRQFEFVEVSRVLVSVAAMLRNDWDSSPTVSNGILQDKARGRAVGTLVPDLTQAETSVPLTARESFNKILHATTINLDRSNATSVFDGYLEPRVHLYGELRGKYWKATIEIFDWVEVVYWVS